MAPFCINNCTRAFSPTAHIFLYKNTFSPTSLESSAFWISCAVWYWSYWFTCIFDITVAHWLVWMALYRRREQYNLIHNHVYSVLTEMCLVYSDNPHVFSILFHRWRGWPDAWNPTLMVGLSSKASVVVHEMFEWAQIWHLRGYIFCVCVSVWFSL